MLACMIQYFEIMLIMWSEQWELVRNVILYREFMNPEKRKFPNKCLNHDFLKNLFWPELFIDMLPFMIRYLEIIVEEFRRLGACLLYTSDAADE